MKKFASDYAPRGTVSKPEEKQRVRTLNVDQIMGFSTCNVLRNEDIVILTSACSRSCGGGADSRADSTPFCRWAEARSSCLPEGEDRRCTVAADGWRWIILRPAYRLLGARGDVTRSFPRGAPQQEERLALKPSISKWPGCVEIESAFLQLRFTSGNVSF